jgi:cytochrome P450
VNRKGDTPITGRNGVAIRSRPEGTNRDDGYRTYEIHQRERIGESTEKVKPIQLMSDAYRRDPYPLLAILRENYPCYRDWLSNRYWLTRYNDVTSVFTDDANFETRSRAWYYGEPDFGRDLNGELPVLSAEQGCYDQHGESIARRLIGAMSERGGGDLVQDFTARLPLALLCNLVGVPKDKVDEFCSLFWQAQRGVSWQPELQKQGRSALGALDTMVTPWLDAAGGDETLLTACREADPAATARDVVRTLLERDHETLQGALTNLWYLLLTEPDQRARVRGDRRMMKLAFLEALRHSTPVLSAFRYARHEVERFGRLIPQGALMVCSAAAANRDPRVFNEPDRFIVDRSDLVQREPRGQYRADGLASGIAFGPGKPSRNPAVPEHQARSQYALIRDTAVTAAMMLLDQFPDLELAPGADPCLSALTVGEMHTCWQLPVRLGI